MNIKLPYKTILLMFIYPLNSNFIQEDEQDEIHDHMINNQEIHAFDNALELDEEISHDMIIIDY